MNYILKGFEGCFKALSPDTNALKTLSNAKQKIVSSSLIIRAN